MNGLYFSIVILALFWGFGASYGYAKSVDHKRLEKSYKAAKFKPMDSKLIDEFLDSFPSNKKAFHKIFYSKKLSQSRANDYLFFLEKVQEIEPNKAMRLMLGLGANLDYRSGNVDVFQMILGKSCARNPQIFAKIFNQYSPAWQENLVLFLKAGPKGPAVGFNSLVTQLRYMGNDELVEKLEVIK